VSETFGLKFRMKSGALPYNFEQILFKARKGELPEENILYFMQHARKFFDKSGLKDKVEEIDKLSNAWKYWIDVKKDLAERYQKIAPDTLVRLIAVENILSKSFKFVSLDKDSYDLRQVALQRTKYYYNYVLNYITVKQKELLYEILSTIWLSIHVNNLLTDSEVLKVMKMLSLEVESPGSLECTVDESLDESKTGLMNREIEPTPLFFRKIVKAMRYFLDEWRGTFFKSTDIYTKIYNAEIYTFSLLMTANKVLIGELDCSKPLQEAFSIVKKLQEYKFIELLRKENVGLRELSDLYLFYVTNLDEMVRRLFGITEDILKRIETLGIEKREFDEDEGSKEAIVTYTLSREISPHEKNYLVGLDLKKDDVIAVLEMQKTGEKIREVEIECNKPYILRADKLPAIILGIGKTGGGKTVHGVNVIRVLLKDNYTVFDISMNVERAGEMIFSSMPLDERHYKKEYRKLTKLQGMAPEKLNMFILIPYYKSPQLPKMLPSCSRIITIPLKTLANKQYALPLLFTKMPKEGMDDVIDLTNLILTTQATDDWDLDTFRFFLKKLLSEKTTSFWIKEAYGDKEYEVKKDIDLKAVRKTLNLIVSTSTLISSAKASTAINFDEICRPGVFVTTYLGHIPDRTACFAFITWLFYSLMDYKAKNIEKKITVFINEAQNIAPSQQLIGGVFSTEKYSLAVDIVSNCLQWRGMAFHACVLTQQQSQLKQQLRSQAGLKIIFHTSDESDLDYAFGDILNQELKENLKLLVKSKLFFDEHLCVYKWGPEDVDILTSAMPPCGVELQNVNPFDLYHKRYPTDTIPLERILRQIELDKRQTFEKAREELGLEDSIKILEEGKRIVGISPDEVIAKKEEIERMTQIPKGKVIVDEKKLEKMEEVGPNKVVVDKTKLEELEKTRPVGKGFIIIKSEECERYKSLPDMIGTFSIGKPGVPFSQIIEDVLRVLIVSCEPFSFTEVGSEKKFDFDGRPTLLKIMEDLGYSASYVTVHKSWKNLEKLNPDLFKLLLRSSRYKYSITKELKTEYENRLPDKVKEAIYKTASILRSNGKTEYLPWKIPIA